MLFLLHALAFHMVQGAQLRAEVQSLESLTQVPPQNPSEGQKDEPWLEGIDFIDRFDDPEVIQAKSRRKAAVQRAKRTEQAMKTAFRNERLSGKLWLTDNKAMASANGLLLVAQAVDSAVASSKSSADSTVITTEGMQASVAGVVTEAQKNADTAQARLDTFQATLSAAVDATADSAATIDDALSNSDKPLADSEMAAANAAEAKSDVGLISQNMAGTPGIQLWIDQATQLLVDANRKVDNVQRQRLILESSQKLAYAASNMAKSSASVDPMTPSTLQNVFDNLKAVENQRIKAMIAGDQILASSQQAVSKAQAAVDAKYKASLITSTTTTTTVTTTTSTSTTSNTTTVTVRAGSGSKGAGR